MLDSLKKDCVYFIWIMFNIVWGIGVKAYCKIRNLIFRVHGVNFLRCFEWKSSIRRSCCLFVCSRVRIQMWATRLHSLPVAWRFRIIFAIIPKVTSSLCAIEKHFRSLDRGASLLICTAIGSTTMNFHFSCMGSDQEVSIENQSRKKIVQKWKFHTN